jgi:hypothetical protein
VALNPLKFEWEVVAVIKVIVEFGA